MGHSHLSRLALRRRVIAAFGLAWLLCLPAAGQARPLAVVKEKGTLRVAVYRDYRPFSWIENGQAKGIDVELAGALAKSLDVTLDLFDLRADDNLDDDLRNGVWRGTVFGAAPGDVMMHVPYDKRIEAKNSRVVLTAPYHVEGLAMAVDPAKATTAPDLSLFLEDKVAVDVGSLADIVLISAWDHRVIPNVVHERGTPRAADAFERGEVAAFYGEASAVQSLARHGTRPFTIVAPPTRLAPEWAIGTAVREDSADLGTAVDEAMRKLASSGEVARIFAAYGVDWRKPEPAP